MSEPENTDDDDRTSAVGLARYAREYYDAAIAADDVIGTRPGYKIHAPPPVMFLVAHSIELVLKAYLRHQGVGLKELTNLGHHLDQCWRAAIEHGVRDVVQLDRGERGMLELIGELHSSTELRYIRTGYKTFPVFGPLQELTKKLLDAICPAVGYR